MKALGFDFARAAGVRTGFTFWLLAFAIIIPDDTEREEQERRKKRDRHKKPLRQSRPAGPRPL